MDYLSNWIFVDECAFDINMRPSTARSAKGTPAIITTPTTHAVSHTILGGNLCHGCSKYRDQVAQPEAEEN
jgi:hypothetical protein